MIDRNQILSFNHYKKGKAYTGSHTGMRYRIVKMKGESEDDNERFLVETWPEPYCYEKTKREKIKEQFFPFTEEGYLDVLKYLNDMIEEYEAYKLRN